MRSTQVMEACTEITRMVSNRQTILMLPWLAHGHISPFLELAKKLSDRDFTVLFCSTPINLQPIRETASIRECFPTIELVDINLPHLPELPPNYHTTKNLPPCLMPLLKTTFDAMGPSFVELLRRHRPDLVIYDFLLPWAQLAACEEGIPAVVFLPCSAATCSFLFHYLVMPSIPSPFSAFIFPEQEQRKMISFMEHISNGMTDAFRFLNCVRGSSDIILIKSSMEIESKYINYLSCITGKLVAPVGPLFQEQLTDIHDEESTMIMEWLKHREASSVVFVSFGTEYFLSREEVHDIARGLELSGVGFIWVIRFHKGDCQSSILEALPLGFSDRVRDRGIVIENWAPQVKILADSSVAGFVSHCGWSSSIEAIVLGVPLIAVPMQLDQPLNARMVSEVGVAMEVKRMVEGKLEAEELAKTITEMVSGEGGKAVRERAKELSQKIRGRGDCEISEAVNMVRSLAYRQSLTVA